MTTIKVIIVMMLKKILKIYTLFTKSYSNQNFPSFFFNLFLYQAVNMFISAAMLGILV